MSNALKTSHEFLKQLHVHCSSVIYVYRVYICLCIFRKINWPYTPNHNYFAILLSCEDELSLCVTKLLRKNNELFKRI